VTAAVTARPDAPARARTRTARRAVGRWAWRLFRRDWRQQAIALALITVAVAATILGAGVATNAPPPTGNGFGSAGHAVVLTDTSGVAAISARFGPVEVIENQPFRTGLANGARLRAQDPFGRYGRPMLSLVSGRYPTGADEIAMTGHLASTLSLSVGDSWTSPAGSRRVVGIVSDPLNLLDEFALVAPGQITGAAAVTVLFDSSSAAVDAYRFPGGAVPLTPTTNIGISPELIVMAVAVIGLIFIGLISAAGFTVLVQRRLRALGMLAAIGATDRHVRLVMRTNGMLVGAVGATLGAIIGIGGWIAYAPSYSVSVNHDVPWTSMPWWLVGTAIVLAVVTATVAARRPAGVVARIPIVTALADRPAPVTPVRRSARLPIVLLVAGPVLLYFSGGWGAVGRSHLLLQAPGLVACVAGLMTAAPLAVGLLGVLAKHAPFTARVALRDLARYRSRSGPALAAGSFAVLIAMLIALISTGRYADSLDYIGPNLPTNQLLVTVAQADSGPGAGPRIPPTSAATGAPAAAIAAALGTGDTLAIDSVGAVLAQCKGSGSERSCLSNGGLNVATPELLAHYGIEPGDIAAGTQLITSRPHLVGTPDLALLDFAINGPDDLLRNPRIQFVPGLPTGSSQPNLLVMPDTVAAMHLVETRSAAVLITTRHALTPTQINTARQIAVTDGMNVETANQMPTLSEVRDDATTVGILLALGVLAMTVGLIRSATVGDLRIMAATGARRRTRRTLTAVTAGALGALAAVLGTAVAYTMALVFFRSQLSERMSQPPWLDLLLVLVGLPLAAALGGWVFAAREPAALARPAIG
jgi:putative ABC transport system permease protein